MTGPTRKLPPIIESGLYSALATPLTVEAEQEFVHSFPRRGVFHVAEDPQALRFYGKLGFRVVGTAERQARIGGKYVDEVIIEKFL